MLPRHGQLGLDRRDGVTGDFGVWPLIHARQTNLNVVGYSRDARHPFRSLFSFVFVEVTTDESGQRDDPLLNGYGDIARVKVGAPLKLVLYISFDLAVGPVHYDLLYLGLIDVSTLVPECRRQLQNFSNLELDDREGPSPTQQDGAVGAS